MMSAFHQNPMPMKRRRSPGTVTSQSSDDDAHHSFKRLRMEDNTSPTTLLSFESQDSWDHALHHQQQHQQEQQQHENYRHRPAPIPQHDPKRPKYHHGHDQNHQQHCPPPSQTPHYQQQHQKNTTQYHSNGVQQQQQRRAETTPAEEVKDYSSMNSLLGQLHRQRHAKQHSKPQRTLPSNSKLY